jgi:hypothetical protein
VVVLVSDGQETCKGDPCAVARRLRAAGTQVEVNVNLRNQFVLDRDLPADYAVTTRLAIPLRAQGNWAGVLVYLDANKYLMLGYWARPHGNNLVRRPFFLKEIAGESNQLEYGSYTLERPGQPKVEFIGAKKDAETIWLRLEKRGNAFTGSFSVDGQGWVKIGDHTVLRMGGARLSLAAANGQAAGAAEVAAEFDFIEVQPAR